MDILSYIKPNDCDLLNDLKGLDLQDFLILLDDYYLEFRDKLNINKLITFGFELEFENLRIDMNKLNLKLYNTFNSDIYHVKNDSTLNRGGEVATPVLIDEEKYWSEIFILCDVLRNYAEIGKNAGGHIHVGTQALGSNRDSWLNFAKLWATYENVIYRFCYGNFLVGRSTIEKFALPLSNNYYTKYKDLKNRDLSVYDIIAKLTCDRRRGVNLNNINTYSLDDEDIRNTIEFRCPNGTLDEVIWQNNLNLFVNLLKYSRSSNFNHDIVDKRHRINSELNLYDNLNLYNEIYLEEALEFSDLIFNNNLDKIYFLRQYLKSFEISNKYSLVSNHITNVK